MFLLDLCSAFKKNKIEFVLVGGYAVALHGAVRGTVDVDLAISLSEKSFVLAEKTLLALGLTCRQPLKATEVFHFRKEYAEKRNLIAWSFVDVKNPMKQLDILILEDAKKIKKAIKKVGGISIPIAALNDLIKMKTRSGRPQDLEDVKALKLIRKSR